jgi:hypothetical protein
MQNRQLGKLITELFSESPAELAVLWGQTLLSCEHKGVIQASPFMNSFHFEKI